MFLFIPSTLLARHTAVRVRPASNMIISNAVVVLFVLAVSGSSFAGFNVCLLKQIAHIPCPGCGVTTGLAELFRLNFSRAFQSNPCSLVIGAGMLVSLIVAIFMACSNKPTGEEALLRLARKGNVILAFTLILNYFFTIIKINHLWQ